MSFPTQVRAVLAKDLRRLAPYLLGTVFVAVVQLAGPDLILGNQLRLMLPVGLFMLVMIGLTMFVIQEDSPTHDRAFWASRPIGQGAMLWAKVIAVGVAFCALPVLVEGAYYLAIGVGDATPGLMLGSLLSLGSVVAMAAVAAAITRTFRGAIAVLVVGWIVVGLLQSAVDPDPNAFEAGARLTQAYLEQVAWLVIGASLLAHAYLTGRRTRTVAMGAVAAAIAIPAIQTSTLDLSSRTPDALTPVERVPFEASDAVSFHLIELENEERPSPDGTEGLTASIEYTPLPAALLRLTRIETHIRGDGVDRKYDIEARRADRWFGPTGFDDVGLDGASLIQRRIPRRLRPRIVSGPEGEVSGLVGADRLAITLSFDAYSPHVVSRIPLEVGASGAGPVGRLIVRSAETDRRSAAVEIGHQWSVRRLLATGTSNPFDERLSFVLFSPRHGSYLHDSGTGGPSTYRGLVGYSRVAERSLLLQFMDAYGGESLPDDWFDDAEIVLVEARYAGSFERTIHQEIERVPGPGGRLRFPR